MLTGFSNAPISKGILIFTTLTSLCFSVAQRKYQLHLDLIPHLLQYQQYWRLLIHQAAFTDSSQLFLSTLILYKSSVTIERLFGTRKFAAFLFLQIIFQTILLSILLPLIVISPLSYPLSYLLPTQLVETGKISPGPFGLIFSILFQYARLVPDTWSIRIGSNFWLGERWSLWILALLLFFSHPKETILPSMLGLLYSSIYSASSSSSSTTTQSKFHKFLNLQKFRLPTTIYSTLSILLTPLIGSTKLPPRNNFAEFPRNPTFEERVERIEGERNALERERERSFGGRYGLNIMRRRRTNENVVVTTTILPQVENGNSTEAASVPAGNQENGDQIPNRRVGNIFTSRGRNWVIVPPPPATANSNQSSTLENQTSISHDDSNQNIDVGNANENENQANLSPTSNSNPNPNQNQIGASFRNYLNQITGEINSNFNETNINDLQMIFPDFSRDRIIRALQICDGNQERAVERLLQDDIT